MQRSITTVPFATYYKACKHSQKDNDLYVNARNGCNSCRAKMVHDVLPLIAKLCGKYSRNKYLDYEDLLQTGLMAVFKATLQYDPKIAKWTTMSTTYAKHSFHTAYKIEKRMKNVMLTTMTDILFEDENIELADPKADDPYANASRNDTAQSQRTHLENAIKTLQSRDELIMRMRFGFPPYDRSHSYAEIGAKYKLTRSRIGQIIDRVIWRLNKQLRDAKNLQDG